VGDSDTSGYGKSSVAGSSESSNSKKLKIWQRFEPLTVFSDEPIYTAIQKMAPRDLARLPVVSRSSEKKLLGLISRSDILRAYDVGIVRKQRGQLMEKQVTLRQEQYNDFTEFRLKVGHHAVAKSLKELTLSDSINVVSIDRAGVLHIPRGKTCFVAGDIITLFGRKNLLESAEKHFLSGEEQDE